MKALTTRCATFARNTVSRAKDAACAFARSATEHGRNLALAAVAALGVGGTAIQAQATPPVLTDVGVDVGSFGESMAIKLGVDIASILPSALALGVIFLAVSWLFMLIKKK